MAKSPRQGDITYIRRCQDTGLSMPESMRIDVREIVPFAELVEPVCYTVWVHGITIILCEDESLVIVISPGLFDVCCLFLLPL